MRHTAGGRRHDERYNREGAAPTSGDVSRREVLKLTAGVMLLPALPQTRRPGACHAPSPPPRFFTREEFAMVDALTEMIIPSDDHSPGAQAAKVAEYLDQHLAASWEDASRWRWREGLQLVDALSREMHSQPFLQATPAQRCAVLECIAQDETTPQKPEEYFFVALKVHTARGYYTSEIGIRTELEYKGNIYLAGFSDL